MLAVKSLIESEEFRNLKSDGPKHTAILDSLQHYVFVHMPTQVC